MAEKGGKKVPEKWMMFGAVDFARLKPTKQAKFDKKLTRHFIADGRDLLLVTNNTPQVGEDEPKRPKLDHVAEHAERMLRGKNVVLIAYSGRNHPHRGPHYPETDIDFEDATEKALAAIEQFDPNYITVLHRQEDPALAVVEAQAFHVAGGNSSGHSANLHGLTNFDGRTVDNSRGASRKPLHRLIRYKVADGTPYIGVSAGQMVAVGNTVPHIDAPSIVQVTRDKHGEFGFSMPFHGLNLLENRGLATQPHFNPDRLTNYGDNETQRIRLEQILEKNPWMEIIALQDNTALKVDGRQMTLVGDPNAKAYIMSKDTDSGLVVAREVTTGDDLSELLDTDRQISMKQRLKIGRDRNTLSSLE